ncbi:M15 family metallopeptidase [Legionella nagasakiensis]|uniref:M15 family metallopeptidase n=1 Tax=Legionella nagasakiensis TaxID=535290 RepID=UPI0010569785|nr:M15 family metallopeptidase [Legionella nagasakiensis]
MKIRYLLLLLFFLFSDFVFTKTSEKIRESHFKSSIKSITTSTKMQMMKSTWNSHCPVSLNDLREVELTYWGFDDKSHQGILIVHKELAKEIVAIFRMLYVHKFPIQRMELMDVYYGDDVAAMMANNTSAFSCREVTGQPGVFSQHSYGRAIDINPLINPYVKGEQVLPIAGKPFMARNKTHRGKITKNSIIYNEFIKYGWDWGGDWFDVQDYQHFEKRAHNQKRNRYGYQK